MTSDELMAELADDELYQRRARSGELERQTRAEQLRHAEAPIVADLARAGVQVASVWDLVNSSTPYPAALPVLLAHLRSGRYPDRVMESLARALAVGPSAQIWETLRDLYMKAEGRGEIEGLAVALAASATAEHLDELIGLLGEESRGDTRIHLVRAVLRVGGPRGKQIVESLLDDSLLGPEARARLRAPRTR